MIVTEIYRGQGLGNQLWCYVTTRVIAKDKGYDFGIKSPEKFKCNDFLQLDSGKTVAGGSGPEGGPPHVLPEGIQYYYNERRINHPENGVDIRTFDKNLVEIPDNTKIDGVMQDEQYILHRKNEIRIWLKVKQEFECHDYASEEICVINFRGGEYVNIKNVFLPQKYWDDAVAHMRKINPNFKFVVITDDVKTAKKFFPEFEVHHFNIAKDYVIVKNAYYLILSNSSFACFPAWLSENLKFCIAPKYWSQHNTSDGYWGCGYNMIHGWHYLDRHGKFFDYETCQNEFNDYAKKHAIFFEQMKIKNNFLVISNYHNDLSWVPEYTENYLIYDKTSISVHPPKLNSQKVKKSPNVGYNLYDYFDYIIDHYENLPDCIIFTKGNVFPRHVTKEYFDRIINNDFFTPIEDYRMHKEKWPICFFASDGGFCELNNDWYLNYHETKYFYHYNDFLQFCFKNPVLPRYIRFAPGGNYIVPKENILKLPKIFYENLRTFVSHTQLPGEAHIIERALYTLWTCNFEINTTMLRPADSNFITKPSPNLSFKERITRRIKSLFEKTVTKIYQ
ncbi:MAG: DUF3431 domain-containing protein [Patescibacteria group bacterium]|jgi:hypothetical protein